MTSILELAQRWAENSRILLVEDDRDLSKLLVQMLGRYDCEVDSAETVGDAINSVLSHRYDLTIVDLVLPDGSGVDVIKTIRAHSPTTPVIVMTGTLDRNLIDEALHCGVVTLLHKPFDVTQQQLRNILTMFKIKVRVRHAMVPAAAALI